MIRLILSLLKSPAQVAAEKNCRRSMWAACAGEGK